MRILCGVIITALSFSAYALHRKEIVVQGTLSGYDKKTVQISTTKGHKMTFPKKYAESLQGLMIGKAQVRLRLPSSELEKEVQRLIDKAQK